MPIYEYVCSSCDEEIETIQKVSDAPLKKCPNCQADTLNKKTSMTSFQLKGGGWYSDGYGNSNGKSGDDSKKVTPKDSTKPATKSTETKTKTETKSKSAGQSKAS
jgi:putative FmdB family regulatory protein